MPKVHVMTAADHILWTQRIRKEEAVNGKAVGNFSVRATIRSEDVPKRFKPGHLDPKNPASSVGFDPKSNEARELKRDLHLLQAPPRGKYLYPETSYQDHGWHQKDFGTEMTPTPMTMAGSLPRAGFGWQEKPRDDPLPPYEMQVPSGPKAARERCPFGEISAEATRIAREKTAARRAARSASSSSRVDVREGQRTPSMPSAKAAPTSKTDAPTSGFARAASEPDFARLMTIANSVVPFNASRQEPKQSMERALDRTRIFYNRHPKYAQWYKPLSNSDVAQFADSYSKCWGVQLYAKNPDR